MLSHIFRTMKMHLLPPSSRSFHAAEEENRRQLAHLGEKLDIVNEQSSRLAQQVSLLTDKVDILSQQLSEQLRQASDSSHAEHKFEQEQMSMFFWQMFRRDPETLEETKLRFFRQLPKATGLSLLFQNAEAKLFTLFVEFCHNHDIRYWATGGTLLGAYRHQDFIPWDDDIDVYITRDQLAKLQLAVNNDPRFRITVIWDWYVPCKQIRFRLTDEDNPCFVDLFTLDWSAREPIDSWNAGQKKRAAFVQEVRDKFSNTEWTSTPYLPSNHPLASDLESLLDKYITQLQQEIHAVPTQDAAFSLVRGPENIDETHSSGPYAAKDWINFVYLTFRNQQIPVPSSWRQYLSNLYGDYLALPKDMDTHEHVANSYIGSSESLAAMNRFLNNDHA